VRRATRTVPTVILHGLDGNEADHWQTWLAEQLQAVGREVRYPQLPDSDQPRPSVWLSVLQATLGGLRDGEFDVVCHSLGCLLWLHHVSRDAGAPKPARVALVAPPSPRLATPGLALFLPVPLPVDAVRRAADGTVLVCGTNDPHCPEGAAAAYGVPLKLPTTVISGGRHLDVAAGYGPWTAVLEWCGQDKLAFRA
jgi:hypothetical protein